MAERRTIGQILMSFGRIDESDVSRALEYQRDNGGYFGEALLALDLVTQEELEWGLASQFDLPYVFPEADTIDPEAAALVSPEWALAHLTLPIAQTADSLTVVVDSPIKTKAVDELSRWTDKRIDLALASATKIRELVRQVYARSVADESKEKPLPVKLPEAFGLALEAASGRFGVSIRKHKAWFWWDDGGTVRRRPLEGTWEDEMERLVSPPPSAELGDEPRGRYKAHVSREAMITPVEVRYMSDESGREYLFRPVQERSAMEERFAPPSRGILSEIRLLARSGSARFIVTTDPPALGHEILPHLPVLLLDPSWRTIYIHAADQAAAEESFSLAMPTDSDEWTQELETLRAFHFDVVTVDLSGANAEEWTSSALDVAAVAFLLWEGDDDRRAAYDAGIRWELKIERQEGEHLEWTLEPLHV